MKAFTILFAGFVLTATLAACQPQGSPEFTGIDRPSTRSYTPTTSR